MSNEELSKLILKQDKLLTTALGNAELFANTTDTQKLQGQYDHKKSTKK